MARVADEAARRNKTLAAELSKLYDSVISACVAANEEIIPKLMSQIAEGARIALQTQKTISMVVATGIAKTGERVFADSERLVGQIGDEMTRDFTAIVRGNGERCADAVNGYIRDYRNLTSQLQQLMASLQKAMSTVRS